MVILHPDKGQMFEFFEFVRQGSNTVMVEHDLDQTMALVDEARQL